MSRIKIYELENPVTGERATATEEGLQEAFDLGYAHQVIDESGEEATASPDGLESAKEMGYYPKSTYDYSDIDELTSARRAMGQGLSLGAADEISGGLEAIGSLVGIRGLGSESLSNVRMETDDEKKQTIADVYREARQDHLDYDKAAQKANPKSYLAGDLAGSAFSMFIPGGAVFKTAGLASKLKKGAAIGGAVGGVEGLGRSEADLTKGEIEEAAKDTLLGGAIGATIGGAVPALGPGLEKVGKALDPYVGATSTRIRNISDEVAAGIAKMDFATSTRTARRLDSVKEFFGSEGNFRRPSSGLRKLDPATQEEVALALANGRFDEVKKLIGPELVPEFEKVTKVLNEMADEAAPLLGINKKKNYFPRSVKDYNKLLEKLEVPTITRSRIESALEAARKKLDVPELSPEQAAEVINKKLKTSLPNLPGRSTNLKQRIIETVDSDMLEAYANPEEALTNYITRVTDQLETQKFLRNATNKKPGQELDVQETASELVEKLVSSGKVVGGQADELIDLLSARLKASSQGPGKVVSALRNLGYAGTIGNPLSALTQLSDVGLTAGMKGLTNVAKGTVGRKVTAKDLGLLNRSTAELINQNGPWHVKTLNKLFKVSGFNLVDNFGKNTFINAALSKAEKLAKKDKDKLKRDIGWLFGPDTDKVIKELAEGKPTENVKLYLFKELSGIQPTTLSEMPQKYLESNNARIAWMLKSFTLKQIDNMRRNVVQEWKKGNKATAVKNLAVINTALTASGMSINAAKDFVLGREQSPDELPEKAVWTMLSTYGLNKYMHDNYIQKGDVKGAATSLVVPPNFILDATKDISTELGKKEPNYSKVSRNIPGIGKLLYYWTGDGADRFNEWREKERKKDRER